MIASDFSTPAEMTASWVLQEPTASSTFARAASIQHHAGSLSGRIDGVHLTPETSRLLVSLPSGSLLEVDLADPSITKDEYESLDGTPAANLQFDVTGCREIPEITAFAAESFYLSQSTLIISRAAHAAFELASNHVRTREQFGGALIDLPAVTGNVGRMRVLLSQIEAAVAMLESAGSPRKDASKIDLVYLVARSTVAEAGSDLARLAHQLHGAKGIREDYQLHDLTRTIWAERDKLFSNTEIRSALGSYAAEFGEAVLWDETTPGS